MWPFSILELCRTTEILHCYLLMGPIQKKCTRKQINPRHRSIHGCVIQRKEWELVWFAVSNKELKYFYHQVQAKKKRKWGDNYLFHRHWLESPTVKRRLIKLLLCLERQVSSCSQSVGALSALRSICIKARRLNVWVGNWRECVVSLGAPRCQSSSFHRTGWKISPGRFTLCAYRWVVHML